MLLINIKELIVSSFSLHVNLFDLLIEYHQNE